MTAEIKLPTLPSPLFEHQKQMVSEYGRACADAAVLADRQARWISVDERLPEPGVEVLVYRPMAEKTGDPLLTFDSVHAGEGCTFSPQDIRHRFKRWCHPTHWMPLPPAPQPVAADHIAGAGKKVEGEA